MQFRSRSPTARGLCEDNVPEARIVGREGSENLEIDWTNLLGDKKPNQIFYRVFHKITAKNHASNKCERDEILNVVIRKRMFSQLNPLILFFNYWMKPFWIEGLKWVFWNEMLNKSSIDQNFQCQVLTLLIGRNLAKRKVGGGKSANIWQQLVEATGKSSSLGGGRKSAASPPMNLPHPLLIMLLDSVSD